VNCRIVIKHHPKLDRDRLPAILEAQFQRKGLSAIEWKAKSTHYHDTDGIEDQLIWASQDEGGKILYAVLTEARTLTTIWAEYGAGSDRTFNKLRQIIESSTRAIMECQGWRRKMSVDQSALYEETDKKPLGITVRIETSLTKLGQVSPKDLIAPALTYVVALVANFGKHAYEAGSWPKDFFRKFSSYSDPALMAWIVAILWAMIVFMNHFVKREVEVKFDV
jgi:hypothetical protein